MDGSSRKLIEVIFRHFLVVTEENQEPQSTPSNCECRSAQLSPAPSTAVQVHAINARLTLRPQSNVNVIRFSSDGIAALRAHVGTARKIGSRNYLILSAGGNERERPLPYCGVNNARKM